MDGLMILVVDDDEDTREFLVMLLSFEGYQTLEAGSGVAALTEIEGQAVQSIVLDLRLPDMDGLTVARRLRANGHAATPIVLVTADRGADVERRAYDAGVTSFLAKPFPPEALLERLKLHLSAST
jgi:CheY-like chemotaxis protein